MDPQQIANHLEEYYDRLKVTRVHPRNHHRVVHLPTAQEVAQILSRPDGEKTLLKGLRDREELMKLMDSDPLHHGYRPQNWKDVSAWLDRGREVQVLGGNRSTKTEFAAAYATEDMVENANHIWAFFHSSDQSSIRQQQARVHKFLPPQWRAIGQQGANVYVKYKEVTGFANDTFILPNGSTGYFFNYKQDVSVLEGYEFDGVWADELIPRSFEDAIRFRLVTRRGMLLETFTPVQGYSLTVAGWLAGAKVLETRPSPLLPGRNLQGVPDGHMPYVMECINPSRRIYFFFTQDTPYGDPDNQLIVTLEGAPKRDVMIRAYGYPEKQVGNAFPKFSRPSNVMPRHEEHDWNGVGVVPPHPWRRGEETPTREALYPALPPENEATNFMVIDPGEAKNYFITWFRVGEVPAFSYIYRDWPPMSTHGPWAEPSDKPDGKPGPAVRQDYGHSIAGYKKIILEAEGWVWDEEAGKWDDSGAEVIEERYMDSRLGGKPVPTEQDPGTSLIQLFEDEQHDAQGRLIGPSMVFLPTSGKGVREGLQMINDRLDYNQDQPITMLNCPRLYVVDGCEQTIYALEEYTGLDGERGALKDPIDTIRYFVREDLEAVNPEDRKIWGARDDDEEEAAA